MATFTCRFDSASLSDGLKVTSGFGALPPSASGRAYKWPDLKSYQQVADAWTGDLELLCIALGLVWIRLNGLTAIDQISGHSISITMTVGQAPSMSIT